MSPARPVQRTCPICGVSLIASQAQAERNGSEIYHCPRCALVIDVSVPAKKPIRPPSGIE
jgi:hypothetical protein